MGGLLFRFARALLDAARASAIIDRIRSRCPELTNADLLLVTRVLADHQRAKDSSAKKAAAKRAAPAKRRLRQCVGVQSPSKRRRGELRHVFLPWRRWRPSRRRFHPPAV